MHQNEVQGSISQNHQKLIEWEVSHNYEKIYEITPSKIDAGLPTNNGIIETSTLLMQIVVSLLLLIFFAIGAYIVNWGANETYIPTPIGWTFMLISALFCFGINYGYVLRYIEDYRRVQSVIGYYLSEKSLIEIISFKGELNRSEWDREEIIGFEINNLNEENKKLDRVLSIIIKQNDNKPFKRKLFRVPTSKVDVASDFIASTESKLF